MKFELKNTKISAIKADCEIILVKNKKLSHKWVNDKTLLTKLGFEGKSEQKILITESAQVYMGVGDFDSDEIRIAISNALKYIKNTKYKSVKIGTYKNKTELNISAIVEGAILGSYNFDKYKKTKTKQNITKIIISTEEYNDSKIDPKKAQNQIDTSTIIATATNNTKELVNRTPNDVTPQELASYAQNLSKKLKNTKCFIGDNKFLKKENMNLFLAVNESSSNPARLIHLTYKPKKTNKKIVLVGKGLTYDSGGLSLKPSDYMCGMKSDKGGACATLGIFESIVKMGLPIELHVIIGATENMIGGDSYKNDDVIFARNGDSVEIQNTDAEGRLVLADCLDYAQDLKPDLIVDFATLTGACVVALGEYTIGVMGNNSKLKHQIGKNNSGELSSMLPFNKYLKKLLKSPVADICNISSSRYGGAITAGLFLDNFIRKENKDKWIHLDIAGPAFGKSAWGYNQVGATGAGVRMVTYWLKDNFSK